MNARAATAVPRNRLDANATFLFRIFGFSDTAWKAVVSCSPWSRDLGGRGRRENSRGSRRGQPDQPLRTHRSQARRAVRDGARTAADGGDRPGGRFGPPLLVFADGARAFRRAGAWYGACYERRVSSEPVECQRAMGGGRPAANDASSLRCPTPASDREPVASFALLSCFPLPSPIPFYHR